jgi:hypothetical protein
MLNFQAIGHLALGQFKEKSASTIILSVSQQSYTLTLEGVTFQTQEPSAQRSYTLTLETV